MKALFVICWGFILASASAEETKSKVLVLTESNFDDTLTANKLMLVEFYAPWCGHCMSLEPEYEKAANQLAEEKSDIVLAKVDATEQKALAEKYEVQGYPTIIFMKDGKSLPFNGERNTEGIMTWLKKKTGPPAVTLKTAEEAKTFKESAKVVLVGLFKDLKSQEADYFLEVANEVDAHPFAISSEKGVYKELGAKTDGVYLFKKFDEGRHQLEGQVSVESIKTFIAAYNLPLVVDFSQEAANEVFGGKIKIHNLLFIKASTPRYSELVDAFREAAKEFRGKVIFVTINTEKEDNQRVADMLGLKKDDATLMRMIKIQKGLDKFKPQVKGINKDIITSFVRGVLGGSIEEYLLCQDLPKDWDKNPVNVLVGSNFDEVAFDPEKDVLVEIYAPWCGHCKTLEPIYEQLGKKFADREDIVVAKMDGTANELVHLKAEGFPTIKLYLKGSKVGIHFKGKLTLEELSLFIESRGEMNGSDKAEDENKSDSLEGEEEEEKTEEEEKEKVQKVTKSKVLVLTESNFDETLAANKLMLVEFYAPWCGHCRSLEPEYEKAANLLAEEESEIVLAKVDATEEKALAEKHAVDGYPTIIFMKDGTSLPFNGERTAESIMTWLKKKTGPPALILETTEEANDFRESAYVVVVGLFKDLKSQEAKDFFEVADAQDEHPFAISSKKSVYKELEAKKDGVYLFKDFDEGRHQLKGQISVESIKSFVKDYSLPLVVEFSSETQEQVFGGKTTKVSLLYITKSNVQMVDAFAEAAKEFRGKVIFVTIFVDNEDNQQMMDMVGLKKEHVPAIRMVDIESDLHKFKPQEEGFSEDIIASFVRGVLEGSVEEYNLSQDLPEDWDKSTVKTLVASNFDEVAFDPKRDVLVEVYAPWCGSCKQLEPIYKELGEKYQDKKDVVVAKMDGTANELVHLKTESYPTIMFYGKGSAEGIEFKGEPSLENLSLFIESKGEKGASAHEAGTERNWEEGADGRVKDTGEVEVEVGDQEQEAEQEDEDEDEMENADQEHEEEDDGLTRDEL